MCLLETIHLNSELYEATVFSHQVNVSLFLTKPWISLQVLQNLTHVLVLHLYWLHNSLISLSQSLSITPAHGLLCLEK